MKNKIYPDKLKSGDKIAIIAPAQALINNNTLDIQSKFLATLMNLGLEAVFGPHTNESDEFNSSSIKSRIEDFHWAFSDKSIKGIICADGGFNSNQLLEFIDWNLIEKNPKVFCGMSDITVLNNAFYAKTGLISYSGPLTYDLGKGILFDYILEYFKKCLFSDSPFEILASDNWSDDDGSNPDQVKTLPNSGFIAINSGIAQGTSLGANLSSLNLLQGTEFMPELENSILFIEDDADSKWYYFDRDLQSLIHLPDFSRVQAILIGRFQPGSNMDVDKLQKIIANKAELKNIPVVAGLDFGHTYPMITFPIGGEVKIEVGARGAKIEIIKH